MAHRPSIWEETRGWPANPGRQMLKEFRRFILCGNLVDLAVVVVIGTAEQPA